jgi:hypothetical protein
MKASSVGPVSVVGSVVPAIGLILILGVAVVIWAVMIRAAKAQRRRTRRRDFGGRHSDFGFLLGALGATDRQRDETEAASDASGSVSDGRNS